MTHIPTRAAALTPLAPAGIAVVALVGPEAVALLDRVFRPRTTKAGSPAARPVSQDPSAQSSCETVAVREDAGGGRDDIGGRASCTPSSVGETPAPQWAADRLRLGQLIDDDEVIDDAIVAARVDGGGIGHVEFTTHGGPRIVQRLLLTLERHGATIVSGGDLAADAWPADSALDREVYGLLPQAQTRRAAAWLLRQRQILPAAIEVIERLLPRAVPAAAQRIRELADSYPAAYRMLHGFSLAIVGPPNAGKSTLANAFCGRPRVLVSAEPGTTRDYVSEPAAMEGVPVTLIDTAGLRSAADPIEAEAIRRARQQAAEADLRLVILDAAAPVTAEVRGVLEEFSPDDPSLLVLNKADLPAVLSAADLTGRWADRGLRVSAAEGTGLDRLASRILDAVGLSADFDQRPAVFTERQLGLLRRALSGDPSGPERISQGLSQIIGSGKNPSPGV